MIPGDRAEYRGEYSGVLSGIVSGSYSEGIIGNSIDGLTLENDNMHNNARNIIAKTCISRYENCALHMPTSISYCYQGLYCGNRAFVVTDDYPCRYFGILRIFRLGWFGQRQTIKPYSKITNIYLQ